MVTEGLTLRSFAVKDLYTNMLKCEGGLTEDFFGRSSAPNDGTIGHVLQISRMFIIKYYYGSSILSLNASECGRPSWL